MGISLEDARKLIASCQEQGVKHGKPMTVAVVDPGGFLVALEREDGARSLTPSVATAKAYTAAIMERPGSMLKGWAEDEPLFFGQMSRMGMLPIVATDGALTIKKDGEILGGIGVGGGQPKEDEATALAALEACGFDLDFDAWASRR